MDLSPGTAGTWVNAIGGTKIVPLCSYVVAQFRRHPEWSGLLAE